MKDTLIAHTAFDISRRDWKVAKRHAELRSPVPSEADLTPIWLLALGSAVALVPAWWLGCFWEGFGGFAFAWAIPLLRWLGGEYSEDDGDDEELIPLELELHEDHLTCIRGDHAYYFALRELRDVVDAGRVALLIFERWTLRPLVLPVPRELANDPQQAELLVLLRERCGPAEGGRPPLLPLERLAAAEKTAARIDYELTLRDVWNARRGVFRREGGERVEPWGWIAGVAGLVVWWVAALSVESDYPVLQVGLGCFAAALLAQSFPCVWNRTGTDAVDSAAVQNVPRQHRLILTPAGLWVHHDDFAVRESWLIVSDIRWHEEFVVFLSGQRPLAYVPQRAFGSPQAASQFIQLALQLRDAACPALPAGREGPEPPITLRPIAETGNPYQSPWAE